MMLPLLAASDWGLVFAIAGVFFVFVIVGYVVIQGTRVQLAWRESVEAGDVDAIRTMVSDELKRWKSIRMPKGTDAGTWHGVQSAELLEVEPTGVRISALAEGQYALASGERREVTNSLQQGLRVTAKLADMVLYDIPNVRLPYVQVDIYSTYRDDEGSSQRCIISTRAERTIGDDLDWDEMEAEDVVRAFGGRYELDERGNALPIPVKSVPAAFYKED